MLTIKSLMDGVHLKMNPPKTEFIYFGNAVRLKKCTYASISIDGDLILRSSEIRYLGAWLDSNLNYKTHVTKKCSAAMANLQRIKSIRHLLNVSTTSSLCVSLCMSHLDYTNALLYGLPDATINKLQWVQNICAKLTLRKQHYNSPKQCLYQLHWLPIRSQIEFKILVLTHKCLNGNAPQYLRDLTVSLQPSRPGLRSAESNCLLIPKTKYKTFAARYFSVAAPTLWNQLPENIKIITDVLTFKKHLKRLLCAFSDF